MLNKPVVDISLFILSCKVIKDVELGIYPGFENINPKSSRDFNSLFSP